MFEDDATQPVVEISDGDFMTLGPNHATLADDLQDFKVRSLASDAVTRASPALEPPLVLQDAQTKQ